MLRVDENDFKEAIIGKRRTFITLFYADWCPFCREFKAHFEKMKGKGKWELALVDVSDWSSSLWEKCNIKAVPTLISFKDGLEFSRKDGILGSGLSMAELESFLHQIYASP